MSIRSNLVALSLAIALTPCSPSITLARPILRKPVAAGNFVQLPYSVTDSAGNQWTIYQNGMLQQRGNTPVYGQGAMLLLNNENIQINTNRARQDDKTGELLFENGTGANLTVTRRILVKAEEGYVRYIDVLKNSQPQDVTVDGGDQLKGTLKEPAYTLHTFYGDVQLPAERIVGMLTTGQFRPRQLLVTGDGQVFGGRLVKETVGLELSSGQLTQVPLSQISRMGYRKRPGESDDTSLDKLLERPMVLLRTGDRMAIAAPMGTVDFMTRYGLLKLKPENVAAVAFQSEDTAVHTAYLVDGSHFAGLVAGQQFTMNLTGTNPSATQPATTPAGAGQSVTFPAASLARLHLTNKVAEPDENTPTLQLVNGDFFVGSLTGQLKLDTLFDTITVNAGEIRTLSHARDGGADVQMELWDQSKLSGQLQEAELVCTVQCGEVVRVPVALIDSYNQPQPQPSAGMVEQIKVIVVDLAADDWKRRDSAEGQLVTMGPVVAGVLKQLAPTQPPEAQQRIESILKQLADRKKPAMPATPGD